MCTWEKLKRERVKERRRRGVPRKHGKKKTRKEEGEVRGQNDRQ